MGRLCGKNEVSGNTTTVNRLLDVGPVLSMGGRKGLRIIRGMEAEGETFREVASRMIRTLRTTSSGAIFVTADNSETNTR